MPPYLRRGAEPYVDRAGAACEIQHRAAVNARHRNLHKIVTKRGVVFGPDNLDLCAYQIGAGGDGCLAVQKTSRGCNGSYIYSAKGVEMAISLPPPYNQTVALGWP